MKLVCVSFKEKVIQLINFYGIGRFIQNTAFKTCMIQNSMSLKIPSSTSRALYSQGIRFT